MRYYHTSLEWKKSGTLTTPNPRKDVEIMGIQNGSATLKDSLVAPYKTAYTFTM